MQQQGYNYAQPGAYPGQPTQYTQQPYGGYPRQQTTGGYAAGWDQSAAGAAPTQQTTQGGGAYDYYNQQQAPQTQPPGGSTAPTDASAYGYSQQGYGQDGYGGYGAPPQSGYGGYDQQGYPNPNLASGYNNTTSEQLMVKLAHMERLRVIVTLVHKLHLQHLRLNLVTGLCR